MWSEGNKMKTLWLYLELYAHLEGQGYEDLGTCGLIRLKLQESSYAFAHKMT